MNLIDFSCSTLFTTLILNLRLLNHEPETRNDPNLQAQTNIASSYPGRPPPRYCRLGVGLTSCRLLCFEVQVLSSLFATEGRAWEAAWVAERHMTNNKMIHTARHDIINTFMKCRLFAVCLHTKLLVNPLGYPPVHRPGCRRKLATCRSAT